MKVMVKFSDLRKLEDNNEFFKNNVGKLEERIYELNQETIRLDNALDSAVEKEREIEAKLEIARYTAEEVKLLTEENNVLTEENNRLKTYAERRQPKFWFGDKVRIKEDTVEEFIIGRITFEDYIFLFSDTFGYYTLYEEDELELITDEHISK